MTKVSKYGPVTCKVDLNKNLLHINLEQTDISSNNEATFVSNNSEVNKQRKNRI